MEGVLDPLMRKFITRVSSVDFCSTEFIRVTDRHVPTNTFFRYAPEINNESKTENGTPVLVQLLGGKPHWMAENAQSALNLGAHGIDINFGCPARNVNRHDGGAALLKDPSRLFDTISTIRKKVGDDAHVSAKVRLGFSDKSKALDISKACSDAGATWLTVHARTKEEGYRPPAHWHVIKKMKDASSIPVFANGDIWDLNAYKKCVTESECSDVMIGRGLMRNPFLVSEIKNNQELNLHLKNQETLKLIIDYFKEAQFVYGENTALGRIKQWLKMCTHPENLFFENIFNQTKGTQTAREALEALASFLDKEPHT
ncbi:MAG: tRNA dihydrouridine synthase [Bdellovibrionales bacterium]